MSSYSSTSSFLSGSDLSTSPSSTDGSHFPPSLSLQQTIDEDEPLDHPLLSTFNKEVVVTDAQGFPVMQTKSAWEKQMKEKEKEDLKKAKKAARKAKHAPRPPPAQTTLTKKEKKEKKLMGGKLDEDDDA